MMGSNAYGTDEKTKVDADTELSPTHSNIVGEVHELTPGETTKRGLKSRHAQMISLGGTIGTGLFVGSGQGLRIGGPLFFFLGYCLLTFLVFGIVCPCALYFSVYSMKLTIWLQVTATTEMSSYLPVPGSTMAYFGTRFWSKSMGFALGWMYWYIFTITVAAEITAAGLVVQYWHPPVNVAVWLTIFILVIIALNCFPVKYYGETEFWFASLKIFGIIGLLIMALVLIFGGGPNHERLGFHYWKHPGPMNQYTVSGASGRLAAFFGTVTFSIFAFAFAPELLVVTGGEMESPRRNLPIAGKRYFWRLIFFYVAGALAISMIVSSDDDLLLGGGSGAGASPWAIAAKRAGIRGLDSVINAVILTSAWSSGNSYLFLASRTLYSMALVGNAPRIFTRCTKSGIPYIATGTSACFCLLAYLNVSDSGATVFNWFANLINTGGYISWIMICIIYLRFRKATFVQGITDLPYRSSFQPYMSYISGSILTILLLVSGFVNFVHGHWNTSNFLTSYIGIAIFLALFFGHKLFAGRHDAWVVAPQSMDLVSGLDMVIAKETPARRKSVSVGVMQRLWE